MERYDAVTSRKDREGKMRYLKIGAAFPSKKGEGFNIVLDALPMPNAEGQAWIMLMPPREKVTQPGVTQPGAVKSVRVELDDEIPYP